MNILLRFICPFHACPNCEWGAECDDARPVLIIDGRIFEIPSYGIDTDRVQEEEIAEQQAAADIDHDRR